MIYTKHPTLNVIHDGPYTKNSSGIGLFKTQIIK